MTAERFPSLSIRPIEQEATKFFDTPGVLSKFAANQAPRVLL